MSPRRRHPVPADPRQHLLDAALRAFARHGYEGTSIRQIAAEARVSTGLLYHYFDGKEALLLALFERSGALVMQAFTAAAAEPDPRQRLVRLVRTSAALVREHEDFWRVSYGVRSQHAVLGQLAVGVQASTALYLGLFSELLAALGDPAPQASAHLLFASLDGVFQHYVLDPRGYPLDAVIDALLARTLPPDAP